MPNKVQIDYLLKELSFVPTLDQHPILYDTNRTTLVAGGERSGKSKIAAIKLLTRLTEGKLFWLVARDYARTRAEFDYICDGLEKLHLPFVATKQVDPGEIVTLDNIRITTKSANDPRTLAMEAPDGIVGCEASQLTYEDYLRLRGRVAEKRGWLHLAGTFESSLGWYPEHFQRWLLPNTDNAKSFSLPSWTNTYVYPGGETDPEILALKASCSPAWFSERFGGVPVPPKGRVLSEFSVVLHTGNGGEFEFDPSLPVSLYVDPGFATTYAVLVTQKRGEELIIIDEVFEKGFITSDIIRVCQQRPWWRKVTGGAIDIAALQHQAMPAVSEIWLKEGGVYLSTKKIRIQDGIEAIKRFLIINPVTNRPLLRVNTKCRGLISEAGGCENPLDGQTKVWQWKMDRENNVVGELPIDAHNHSSKALAYGIINSFGYTPIRKKGRVKFY